MNQATLEALLGRSLTPREATNIKLYLKIARESLEDLLCISLCDEGDDARIYEIREGYRTVFTDIFTDITSVKVDGTEIDTEDYYKAQWDKRSGSWFNSIVFDKAPCGEIVEVVGSWGFGSMPSDLKTLWAQLFANTSKKYLAGNVKSKKVEDFSITFSDSTDDEAFMVANRRVIQKYGMCNIGYIRHGKVRRHGRI